MSNDRNARDRSTETITVCPDCGSAEIRVEGAPAYENNGQSTPYRCDDCGAAFDEPAERVAESQTSANAGTTAAALEAADPEVVFDGGPSRTWDGEDCPRENCEGELQQQDRFNVMCQSCGDVFAHHTNGERHWLENEQYQTVKTLEAATDGGREWVRCEECGDSLPRQRAKDIDISYEDEYYPKFVHLCPSCASEPVTDGGRDVHTYRIHDERPTVSYGPRPDADGWVIAFTTDRGRVEIALDEESMYQLWVETRNVPWPNRAAEGAERDRLVREVVHAANDADEDMLRDALDALGADR